MRIVIDGNDGLGKSTLVGWLEGSGYDVADRGVPTKMTDSGSVRPADDECYIILDGPVELSRERLAKAGRDLDERYHTIEDLTHYRKRFLEVAKVLPRCRVISAEGSPERVFLRCRLALAQLGVPLP
jgi:thymidylate kinase